MIVKYGFSEEIPMVKSSEFLVNAGYTDVVTK